MEATDFAYNDSKEDSYSYDNNFLSNIDRNSKIAFFLPLKLLLVTVFFMPGAGCDNSENTSNTSSTSTPSPTYNISGSYVPSTVYNIRTWPQKHNYVVDVGKAIVDRGLSVKALRFTKGNTSYYAPLKHEYHFELSNIGQKPIEITGIKVAFIGEEGVIISVTELESMTLHSGQENWLVVDHRSPYHDKANQVYFLIERLGENDSVVSFVAIERLREKYKGTSSFILEEDQKIKYKIKNTANQPPTN